jgi:hypothetical protein
MPHDVSLLEVRALISYGAHDSYVHSVEDFLVKSGFSVEVDKEMSYFDRNSNI